MGREEREAVRTLAKAAEEEQDKEGKKYRGVGKDEQG